MFLNLLVPLEIYKITRSKENNHPGPNITFYFSYKQTSPTARSKIHYIVDFITGLHKPNWSIGMYYSFSFAINTS